MDEREVDAAIAAVSHAFPKWSTSAFSERAQLLRMAAKTLRADSRWAADITREMGKPVKEARAEVEKCAWVCDYFAENGEEFLRDTPMPSDSERSFVAFEPLGPVLAIMPWNFPLWQVFRFLAPALMAGNTALLKHAGNTTRSALNVEAILREAGLPSDVFRTLVISGDETERVIADARVVAVTLTGSDATGSKVAAEAGRNLKKTVLELGGSDVFIVLDDADVAGAAEVGARARFQNCGQSCIAAKRFLVLPKIAADFVAAFKERAGKIRLGDPMDERTEMGPMARDDLRDSLRRQLDASLRSGAKVVSGGNVVDRPGFYFEPTVIVDSAPEMPVFSEETFGPLAAVMTVKDEDEAVEIANRSVYGLGGNVWTQDAERGMRIARRLETGGVFINGMTHSDPRLPFGGIKRSGYGRELSWFGIREFVNAKTIWMA